jgi:superfamily II DNA or RNA helicase
VRITVPEVFGIKERKAKNDIVQIAELSKTIEGSIVGYQRGQIRGSVFRPLGSADEILILPQRSSVPPGHSRILRYEGNLGGDELDLRTGRWTNHPLLLTAQDLDRATLLESVLASWKDAFIYAKSNIGDQTIGLRSPQIGAVHATHAHWATSHSTATVVMPTGTGKTDTMLSILVSYQCAKVAVVVPTDALRQQISTKFQNLGILKDPRSRVLASTALFPIVATLRHVPKTVAEVDQIFGSANVTVMTSSIAGACSETVRRRIAHHCNFLFVDEAHHSEAPSWKRFKEAFANRTILQFTATPFREDGQPLDGKIIFKYPLKQAQDEGYFQPIRFTPVIEFNPLLVDSAIASKAVEQLQADWDKGHIVMARVDSVERARQVAQVYAQYPQYSPIELHTGIASRRERDERRARVVRGESRIVICVDMLGEGFDLPELKIAAFHDIRKSLAVTLQLAGRFTRVREDLGHATFIANTADVVVQEELRKLYARDPDWNLLIPELSERAIGNELSLQEFLEGFTPLAEEIPLRLVRPAMSTVVYRTQCEAWNPANFREGIPNFAGCSQVYHSINENEHTLIVVTARRTALDWTEIESLYSWAWDLYVVHWDPVQNLAFVNGSSNSGQYRSLVVAVCGEGCALINGQAVFRTFSGINRVRFQNIGLTEQLGRHVRYTGRMGSDVEPVLGEAQRRNTTKSVLAGSGFEDGDKVTIGASKKGRIWSHKRCTIDQLTEWARHVGSKLLDESVDPDQLLSGTLKVRVVATRPPLRPIMVDWPEELYRDQEGLWYLTIGERDYSLSEVELELVDPADNGPLRFAISTFDGLQAELQLVLTNVGGVKDFRVDAIGDVPASIGRGQNIMKQPAHLFFFDSPPIFWFTDGSSLEGNHHVELRSDREPYDRNKIDEWDWDGVDIRVESQGTQRRAEAIQAKVIRQILIGDDDLVFDDDGKGEAADIVTVKVVGGFEAPTRLDIGFYHCKYAHGAEPGARLEDLYELCGQAQKCVTWMSSPEKQRDLFTHLLRRNSLRLGRGQTTRFERGDIALLSTIREISSSCEVSLRVFIVQPGLSKLQASHQQLELLGVTENYLLETYQLPFRVIGSP